ncbi:LIM zinc-binding domain-containing Nebulette,LIM and SH3 domain protein F42H10.3,LIM and SH3 domain protein 1,LIM and SH3 domain protein Lasp [Mytilus coruscus]|uniref:LIM zinc-binding domain-containing Nebulette,LIM and SH3 domain protein F42H10.3,LIM and SH3 domain protein 1,LIM and SH3 domain protein Lasp n=1 Tax=Mytilus coruscus TaxID=42192 RepID=A0A6J8EI70_MYTCO|nr:LIM zinc-binding domain-containing Nebulette,LIM and SH3 domain protein F42H10.3,LIM and SH3 domain protein 1,LIM and SH3 domain protein Lasp [Mytilus coruscus]
MCCTCTMNLLITYFLLFGTDALIKGRGWVCKIVQCYAIGPNIWHKGCFKCQVCNMTLNMKNYKGYNKLPYCNAHYPTTKPTQVADTPENRRIADNTKIQSNIKYHEDFERQKGKKMTVVDDPETQRVRQNTQNFSQVAYSGHRDQLRDMEYKRPAEQVNVRRSSHPSSPPQSPGFQNEVKQRMSATSPPRSPGYRDQQEVRRTSATSPPQSPGYNRDYQEDVRVRPNPGSIHNYDPVRDQQQNQGTPYSSRNSGAVVYDSNTGRGFDNNFNAKVRPFYQHHDNMENPSSQRRVGSISDYDPINDRWGSVTGQFSAGTQQPRQPPPPQQFAQPPAPQEADRFSGKGMVCRAAYDYVAADDDEVSFNEGDHIIFCQPIDAGWMEGTVEATGRRGMLPSNYVETVKK